MTTLSDRDRIGGEERSRIERIRAAALECFAKDGTSATSLRTVASAACVSLGLVQHHFATKAGLIKAVDDYVLGVVIEILAQPIPPPPADSLVEMGNRVNRLISEYPDIVDYFSRALMDGSPLGTTLFDTLAAFGTARWNQRKDNGELRPDVDVTWAAINALVLSVGTLALRSHIERHLPEPMTRPDQLRRWQTAVNTLLRDGLFRRSLRDIESGR